MINKEVQVCFIMEELESNLTLKTILIRIAAQWQWYVSATSPIEEVFCPNNYRRTCL